MSEHKWTLDIHQRETPPVSGVNLSQTGNRASGAKGALAQMVMQRNAAITWKVELQVRATATMPWVTLHTVTQADVPEEGGVAIHEFDYQLAAQYRFTLDNDSTRVVVALAG